jgi:hypothetical protein
MIGLVLPQTIFVLDNCPRMTNDEIPNDEGMTKYPMTNDERMTKPK